MALFWILAGVDALAGTVILYFLAEGLGDGTVSSSNGLLWTGFVGAPALILLGGFLLKSKGRLAFANVVMLILAVPALLYGLMILVIVVAAPDFR